MKASLLQWEGAKTFVLVFEKGDPVIAEVTAFAKRNGVTGGHFSAIGAFSDATLGYFDRTTRQYRKIPVPEQVEVVSLLGDVALDGDEPKVHAHAVVARADGTVAGGHLLEAHVWSTLELVLAESPRHLRRRTDPETGLALIDLAAADAARRG